MFLSGYHLQEGCEKNLKKRVKRQKEREEEVRGHDLAQRFYFQVKYNA